MNLLSRPIGRSRRMERGECEAGRKEERERELSRRIEVSCRFEQLRGLLNDFEKDKIWEANEDAQRKEEVGRQLPTILEEGGAENSSETGGEKGGSSCFGNGGD